MAKASTGKKASPAKAPAAKPAAKAAAKPVSKAAAKPAPKAAAKPAAKAAPAKPAAKPAPKATKAAPVKAAAKPVAKAEAKPAAKAVAAKPAASKAAAKPAAKAAAPKAAAPKAAAKPEPKVVAKAEPKVASKPEVKPVAKAETKTPAKVETKPAAKTDSKVTTKADPSVATKVTTKLAASKETAVNTSATPAASPVKAAAPKKVSEKETVKAVAKAKPLPEIPVKKQQEPELRERLRNVSTSATLASLGIEPYPLKADEAYMNDKQHKHFRSILNKWKVQLREEVDRTVHHMQDEAANFPDQLDRAVQEEEFSLELRTRDRERKLLKKIDEALKQIDADEYGYCEQCGVEIGVRRLEARPTATLCVDCKTLAEIKEKQYGG